MKNILSPVPASALLFAAACGVCRADTAVRTAGFLLVTNDAEVVSVSTVAGGQAGVPADMPDPVFWLDASDTEGWTIVTEGAYRRVKTVPSKGRSGRYATTDVSAAAGDTWYGWQYNATTLYPPRMPYLIDDPDLLPGKALDFVVPGGTGYAPRIGLVFNRVPEAEGLAPTNAIFNIGTVIAVYGSHDGRGWFLGGGRSGGGATFEWNRNVSQMPAANNVYDWTAPVIQSRSNPSNAAQSYGVVRHDGLPTSPVNAGFNHAWEVLSWTMQSATAVATGIGLGDTRGAGFERTGQQRIAEMLIFDSVLPLEMVEKIETYLNAKWFGRTLAGFGGRAEVGTLRSVTPSGISGAETGLETEVSVSGGENLTIDRLEGGRGLKSVVRKTGAGTLAVRDATDFGGRMALAGGTLSVPLKAIPESIEKIVTNCYYHADASQIGDIDLSDEGGVEYVMGWRNRAEGTLGGLPVMLAPIAASRRPWLVRNALGEGLHVIDFGEYSQSAGHYMSFTTSSATSSAYPPEKAVNGIVTVVAVYGARGSGASIFNKIPWSRPSTSIDTYMGWAGNILNTAVFDTSRGLSASNAVVFVDGIRLDPVQAWFGNPGFQVLAVRNTGDMGVTRIGCSASNMMGGFQLGEIYVFRRQLSDGEMADLSAYLTDKWFGCEMNGYAAAARRRKAPDIAVLDVEASSTFAVETGSVVRVGSLGLSAPLAVSGGGTLEIGALDNPSGMPLDANGARVEITGPMEPPSSAEPAADPAFHLDPSKLAHFEVLARNGTNFVMRARDGAMKHQIFAPSAARCPWLDTSVVSESLPVLNFGPYGYYGCNMAFDRPIDAVRSVYAVWAPNSTGPREYSFMFGSTDRMSRDPLGGRLYDYHRGTTADSDGLLPLFAGNSQQQHVTGGEIYVDGTRSSGSFKPRAGELRLIEMHHTAPAHIAAFATDRKIGNPGRNGGSMFGEALIYTRVLTEREKVATRNYLLKKWFGRTDDELEELPGRPEGAVGSLAGAGEVVKSGGNTLVVNDVSAFTGTLSVAEGTLRIARPLPAAAPELVTDGLVFHVDANEGIELVEGTANSVKKWNSVLGDGWSAVSANALLDPQINTQYPALRTGMNDGTPFVCMNHNRGEFMVFCKDGVRTRIKNIKTVFWVVGTDDGSGGTLGGGFLLGGGNCGNPDAGTSSFDWHRGGLDSGAYRRSFDNPLTGGSACTPVRDGRWFMDGVEVDGMSAGLGSNRWHYITASVESESGNAATADGFAFDGRWLEGDANFLHRTGGQSLAEVLIYNRSLDDAERAAVESYLAARWGFSQKKPVNGVDLVLAPGTVLDCGGSLQYFASISGAGSVAGDVSAARLVADAAAAQWPSVSGVFVLPQTVEIELRNLPANIAGTTVKILDCAGLTRPSGSVDVSFAGEALPGGVRARLAYSGGALRLKLLDGGMVMTVR